MKKTLKSILATMLVAATLTTTAPITAIPAAAATTTSTTTAAATTKTTTMYVTKSCYSYKTNSTKSAKVGTYYKGAAIKVTATKGSFYKLADGSYVKKTNVGAKRINWTDTKYTTTLTRYTAKDNVKVRSGALSTSKVVKTLKKGTKLTIVAKTNSGYYKLSDGNYVLATSVTKTKPTTATVTTNTAFPEDPYGPGENGYPSLGYYETGNGEGYGYLFIDLPSDVKTSARSQDAFINDLTVIGGKDVPYGWYCIVGRDHNSQHARAYFPYETASTLDIYDVNGKHKTYGIYQHGELFYLGKGEKLVARNVIIAPAKNATIIYRGVAGEDYYGDIDPRNTDLQQSSLVTAKGTGYGIEAGTYKVTVDPDTERFDEMGTGAWIYVVHNYANIQTVDVHQTADNAIGYTRNLAATGEFLYSDLSLSPDHFETQEFYYCFDKNGNAVTSCTAKQVQSEKDLTPKTITLKAGDLIICRGCTVSKIG